MNLDQSPQAPRLQPSSPTEQYMARLWLEVIGIEKVALPNKFLEVGGNSLTLNIILTRIEGEKGVAMNPQQFFDDERSSLLELTQELDLLLSARPARAV